MGAFLISLTVNLHHQRKEKQMRKVLSVSLLIMLLVCSARADTSPGVLIADAPAPATFGDIHTVDLQPGDMHTGDIPSTDGHLQNGAAVAFVQVVLNLLALS
jgi:hypothetical protein